MYLYTLYISLFLSLKRKKNAGEKEREKGLLMQSLKKRKERRVC